MGHYVLKRIGTMLLVVVVESFLVFALMRSVPGGPWDDSKYPLSAAAKANIMRAFGFNKPPLVQYLLYMWNAVHGNFGIPFEDPGETVTHLLARAWPVTLAIGLPGITLAIIFGIALGVISAFHENDLIDYSITALSSALYVIPSFVVALLVILLFSVQLGWFGAGGLNGPKSLVLPIFVFSLVPTAQVIRYTRTSVLDVMHQDYVRTARAKGLHERAVIMRHILRNALIPIITILGPLLTEAFIATTYVESVFALPGIGRYLVSAIQQRDYPLTMAVTIITTVLITLIYLVSDLLYVVVDRRISLEGDAG